MSARVNQNPNYFGRLNPVAGGLKEMDRGAANAEIGRASLKTLAFDKAQQIEQDNRANEGAVKLAGLAGGAEPQ